MTLPALDVKAVHIHPYWRVQEDGTVVPPWGTGKNHHQGSNCVDFLKRNYPDEVPDKQTVLVTTKDLEVAPGVKIRAVLFGDHIFVSSGDYNHGSQWNTWTGGEYKSEQSDETFITARVIGNARTKKVQENVRRRGGGLNNPEPREVTDYYTNRFGYHHSYREDVPDSEKIPYAYLQIEISADGAESVIGQLRCAQPESGVVKLVDDGHLVHVKSDFFGMGREWTESLHSATQRVEGRWGGYSDHYTNGLKVLYRHLKGATELVDSPDTLWERFFAFNKFKSDDERGVKALLKRKAIKPVIDRLKVEAPLDHTFFRWLFNGKTVNKKSNNQLLGAMLRAIGDDYKKLVAALRNARNEVAPTTSPSLGYGYGWSSEGKGAWFDSRRAICHELPGAKEKVEEQEAKADWSKQKSQSKQADALGIDKKHYPRLRRAVETGKIPASVFRQPDKDPVNREYPIWEKALKRKGWAAVIFDIAKDAGRRSTYEKDITPYLAFLFCIEKYLGKHSKKRGWKAFPKFVRSQWELEMDDTNESGTTTKRSAFTPVADNEKRTVTVPYVAVAVHGVRTQWCYARHYHVFEEGMTDQISGGIVIRDLEPKLNGRDDYGLCFYTLTGTVTARGYPTFLIIFERLDIGTRVHFHRVRPQRSKNKRTTPACELIEACYQYMAGNIPAEDISAQQGDLIFIQHPNDPVKAGAKVGDPQTGRSLEFESHRFSPMGDGGTMGLYESKAKTPKNRLGFLWAPNGLSVSHPEHDDIPHLEEGWWEIRRCKSWEANPQAIWSLTID